MKRHRVKLQAIRGICRRKIVMKIWIKQAGYFWGKKKKKTGTWKINLSKVNYNTVSSASSFQNSSVGNWSGILCTTVFLLVKKKVWTLFAPAPPIPGDTCTPWRVVGSICARGVSGDDVVSAVFVLIDWIGELKFIRFSMTFSSETSI